VQAERVHPLNLGSQRPSPDMSGQAFVVPHPIGDHESRQTPQGLSISLGRGDAGGARVFLRAARWVALRRALRIRLRLGAGAGLHAARAESAPRTKTCPGGNAALCGEPPGAKPIHFLQGSCGTAEEAAKTGRQLSKQYEKRPSAAKAGVNFAGLLRGLKPPPPSDGSFSAACEAHCHSLGIFWPG